MGTTLCSVHVYTNEPIDPALGEFRSFSEGWQTAMSVQMIANTPSFARKLSRKIQTPVLMFDIYDSDEVEFVIFENGRTSASYSTYAESGNKGISKIPGIFGYPDSDRRRLSAILRCYDIDQKVEMLEEFFGVALIIDDELIELTPEYTERCRGEELYLAYREQERMLRGKRAPVHAVLTEEFNGKLFDHRRESPNVICVSGYYFFGYDSPESEDDDLCGVHFENGQLKKTTAKVRLCLGWSHGPQYRDDRYFLQFEPNKITFTDLCPEAYRGRTFSIPARFCFPIGFNSGEHLILSDGLNGLACMNPEGKVIAMFSVQGSVYGMEGGYVLTVEHGIHMGYRYDPESYIRIYYIEDK